DTRADVYSLGVMLYELLTGELPFNSHELRKAALAEVARIIKEVTPPKPSTRLAQLAGERTTTIAAARSASRERITSELRRELDWIPLMALRKERERRYASPQALADDVQRYLEGRPLRAAPDSKAYLARKFVKRNKVQVFAASAVFVALSAGLAVALWQRNIAIDAKDAEASERARADERADAALKAEKAEKERADQLKKVSDFQSQMLAQIDTTKAGIDLMADVRERFVAALEKSGVPEADRTARVDALRQELVRVNATDAAAAMIDRTILRPAIKAIDEQFKDDPVTDASLRQALAALYYERLGLYDAALPLQESALATRRRVLGEGHPQTLSSINNLGVLHRAQGKLDQAEPYFREALERRRRVLGEEHPETLTSVAWMGTLLQAQGKLDQAEPYFREALEKSRRVLGEEHPDTLLFINNMGFLFQAQGKLDEAEPYFREALEKRRRVLGEEHPTTLAFVNNMGNLLRAQGKLDQAEPYYREALEKSRRVLGDEHPDTLSSINNMGFLLVARGKLDRAELYLREALEKYRRVLGDEHPSTLAVMSNLAVVLQRQGKRQETIDLLLSNEPAVRKAFTGGNARRLADFLTTLGRARVGLGYDAERFKLAEANLLEAHPIYLAAKDRGPTHKDTLDCVQGLVDLYTAWDKAEPGKGYDAKAAEWKAKLPTPEPANAEPVKP
ncbi:MAG: tetratricopeptide repeat protein, partial [Planctomycetota bacterium]|nr:tetratricopeptide repeat protein [Planctomycetota bacterium]